MRAKHSLARRRRRCADALNRGAGMMHARFRARRPARGHARRDGSAAVEFALIAFPFFFMIFAVMEIALIFLTDSLLDSATTDAGRMVRTGQAAESAMTRAGFEAALCSRMSVFSTGCAERATIDVQTLTSFSTPPTNPTADGATPTDANTAWVPGSPDSLVVVRVWYRQPAFTPFLAQALQRTGDGTTLLTATTAFRNEPWNP